MEEKIFYEQGTIKITSTRFIVDEETYSVANISSVKNKFQAAKRVGVVFWFVIGIIWIIASFNGHKNLESGVISALIIGGVFLSLAWFYFKRGKAKYLVILHTSGNEVKALESPTKSLVDDVVKALNDSIVYRG